MDSVVTAVQLTCSITLVSPEVSNLVIDLTIAVPCSVVVNFEVTDE